jgi:hypothetical protein
MIKSVVSTTAIQPVTFIKWPIQEIPGMKTFTIWRSILSQITKCDQQGNLYSNKMGNWIPNYHNEIQILSMIYQDREHIVIRKNNKFQVHKKTHNLYIGVYDN